MTPHPELDLPSKWAPLVMPRKDARVQPQPITVDQEAADRIDRLVREHFALVESFFPPIFTDQTLREVTARHLATAPDPAGAAVLHLILGSLVAEAHQFGSFLDAWIAEHGTAFAAAAVLERCMISSEYVIGMGTRRVKVDEVEGLKWAADLDRADLRCIRTAIASADEYEDVVRALSTRRSSPRRKMVAALLVPSETGWVDEALDAGFPEKYTVAWMLWHAVSTPEHLAALERRRDWPSRADTGMLATFLAATGSAGLPALAVCVPRFGWKSPERKELATALTAAESPEAMRRLLTRLDVPGAVPLAGAVVRRFPVMAVKAIADHVSQHEATPALQTLLPSDPTVWRQIAPDLTPADTDAIASLREVGPETPVAPASDLPELLTEPPWQHRDRAAEPPPPLATPAPVQLELNWRAGEEPDPLYQDPTALLDAIADDPSRGELLLPMAGLHPARLAASWLAGKPLMRKAARAWLDRHGTAAVPWLAPDALGEPGPNRDTAAYALRHLAYQHGEVAVAAALPTPETAARTALRSILGPEALYVLPRITPRIPDWAHPSLLPPIWVPGREAVLPVKAVEHLLIMLLLSASDVPYAGLQTAFGACDIRSLQHFSGALVEQWERVGREQTGAKNWVPRQAELIRAAAASPRTAG